MEYKAVVLFNMCGTETHMNVMCLFLCLFRIPRFCVCLEFLTLPESNEWNVYVCCINSSIDVVVRLAGEGYSVSKI